MAHGDMFQALPQLAVLLTSHNSDSQTFNTIWKSMMSPCLIKGTLDGIFLAALHSRIHGHRGDNLADHYLKISSIIIANTMQSGNTHIGTSFEIKLLLFILFVLSKITDQWWKDSLVQ